MSRSYSMKVRLIGSVGLLVVLLVAASVNAWVQMRAIDGRLNETLGHDMHQVLLSAEMKNDVSLLADVEHRILLVSAGGIGNVEELASKFDGMMAEVAEDSVELAKIVDTAKDRAEKLQVMFAEWKDLHGKIIAAVNSGRVGDALAYAEQVTAVAEAAAVEAQAVMSGVEGVMQQSGVEADEAYVRALWVLGGLFGLSLLVAGLVSLSVFRMTAHITSLAKGLAEGAEQVASAAQQVSTAAQNLSQGTTEQAASLEETSASMEEMASMARMNSENATRVAQFATLSGQEFQGCRGSLEEMETSMAKISDSSDKVSRIIKTIDEIAFQTNILALNAAVEAARAGEAGMGFAVVADEVRSLAQRSAQAAKDTAALIEEAVSNSHAGEERLRSLSVSIAKIGEHTVQVKSLADEVSTASGQQTQGVSQVTQAIQQMEKVTQTNAATAEESAAASEELTAQAEASMATVRELLVIVQGGDGRTQSPAAEPPADRHAVSARVLRMRARGPAAAPPVDPEVEIPMGDGTFGKF